MASKVQVVPMRTTKTITNVANVTLDSTSYVATTTDSFDPDCVGQTISLQTAGGATFSGGETYSVQRVLPGNKKLVMSRKPSASSTTTGSTTLAFSSTLAASGSVQTAPVFVAGAEAVFLHIQSTATVAAPTNVVVVVNNDLTPLQALHTTAYDWSGEDNWGSFGTAGQDGGMGAMSSAFLVALNGDGRMGYITPQSGLAVMGTKWIRLSITADATAGGLTALRVTAYVFSQYDDVYAAMQTKVWG